MLNTLSFADAEDADGIVDDDNIDSHRNDASNALTKSSSLSASQTASASASASSNKEIKLKEVKKNPFVDTSFLPDKEREAKLKAERHRLKNEWITKQTDIKKELL
eukprot:1103042_1